MKALRVDKFELDSLSINFEIGAVNTFMEIFPG
jgi:hypothetical protein